MTRAKSTLSTTVLKQLQKVAVEAAEKGAKRSMKHFRQPLKVMTKIDRSPVTKGDRESEEQIRKHIRKTFKDHYVIGEEFGEDGSKDSEFQWRIDPIDGTLMYVRGMPYWGSVIGVEYQGEVVAGSIFHPVLELHLRAAKGLGCFANRKRCKVSGISKLEQSTILFGNLMKAPEDKRQGMTAVLEQSYDSRGFGDCYGHALVIQGFAEALMDPVVSPHDISAIKICTEEAGGRYTCYRGLECIEQDSALSSNSKVHAEILSYLSPKLAKTRPSKSQSSP